MLSIFDLDHERQSVYIARVFFALVTPGEEKTLRAAYGLEPNPWLEDVTPTSDPDTVIAKIRKVVSDARSAGPRAV